MIIIRMQKNQSFQNYVQAHIIALHYPASRQGSSAVDRFWQEEMKGNYGSDYDEE